ncbi:hypothetical protein Pse7367_3181 [Thalassoporum mexicanum PCC 7367]|uniref:hypothetical protein n=1 Tax=Thalassoporum mexicanum TaxID=3457544 RepID=UPI00029FCE06|nr:hypothetical protein [Pseudanabaena sp. PCC 7367]AFY71429.1 hypothetical protein Pse7367_3181 [Pseudanabaena sp. PCC 7367]
MIIELENQGAASIPSEMDPDGQGFVYGNAVFSSLSTIDAIARERGLSPLGAFMFEDAMLFADVLEDALEADEKSQSNEELEQAIAAKIQQVSNKPEQDRWYDPAECLATVRKMRVYIHVDNHKEIEDRFFKDPQLAIALLWDLEAYERILAYAESQNTRFAFSI